MGDHCTKSCPSGRFGPDCVHECFCHNGAQCNKVDGRCQCAPGFAGTRCEFECPEGLFGQDCAQACNCPSQNHICNPINGCMCPLSYEGPNCTQPVSPVPEPVLNGSGQPAIIFAGILGSVFVLISIVVICFLKRKHRKLRKEQQAQALYIASSELGGEAFVGMLSCALLYFCFSPRLWLTLSHLSQVVVVVIFIPCLSLKLL